MPKPARKKRQPLEVFIMFEPTRLAHDYLQTAYAHLAPTLQRRIQTAASPHAPLDHTASHAERNAQ